MSVYIWMGITSTVNCNKRKKKKHYKSKNGNMAFMLYKRYTFDRNASRSSCHKRKHWHCKKHLKEILFVTFQSFIILFFKNWYVFSMNCFNAKLMIAPLVHIATKKKIKRKMENSCRLSEEQKTHCPNVVSESLPDITNTVWPLPWSQAFTTADLITLSSTETTTTKKKNYRIL